MANYIGIMEADVDGLVTPHHTTPQRSKDIPSFSRTFPAYFAASVSRHAFKTQDASSASAAGCPLRPVTAIRQHGADRGSGLERLRLTSERSFPQTQGDLSHSDICIYDYQHNRGLRKKLIGLSRLTCEDEQHHDRDDHVVMETFADQKYLSVSCHIIYNELINNKSLVLDYT
ncbi:unnamed protein product [Danaus chrysippus]|uniref:(African queen) hypothetical protein n=1 Tax=Danaus chrysippus TaxID=151541 RepID=A0A8J2R590_9NEOP|nr:unnamed protein product [Danaus chrysippus]